MNLSENLAINAFPHDGWIAVAPGQMPPAELFVVGWHDELERPVVIFYDVSYDDEDGPRWSVCADGGEFPLNAITHWRYCARPSDTGPGTQHILVKAPYCTLQIPAESYVDHVSMRAGVLAEVLRLMATDEPSNFMTSLSARLADELRDASCDIPKADVLTKQLAEIFRNEQTDQGPGDLLWLCQQIANELNAVLGAMIENATEGAKA